MKIKEMRDRALACVNEAQGIQDKAAGRALSADELSQIKAKLDEADKLNAEAKALEDAESVTARLAAAKAQPAGRAVRPEPVTAPAVQASRIDGGADHRADRPWESFGHMAQAVRDVYLGRGMDVRLNAAVVPATESVGSEGGFLVPPDTRTQIVQKVFAEDSLAGQVDSLAIGSNSIELPVDTTTQWGTRGIQVYWEGEGAALKDSKWDFDRFQARASKISAFVATTDELLEDTTALSGYLSTKVPEKIDYKLTDAILNGSGVGQPLGMLKSAFKVAVPKENAQVADTIVKANIDKMWSTMYAPFRKRGIWIINQDCEPQLDAMVVTSNGFPAYLPPGGLSSAPYATLKGRPVLVTEAASALGDEGDILFVDPMTYCLVTRGGLRSDVSIHFLFDTDRTAFRFVMRVGGQPWFKDPIDRAKGANKLSGVVSLAARA